MTTHGFTVIHPLEDMPPAQTKLVRLWDCGVTWRDVNPAPDVFVYDRLDSIIDKTRAAATRIVCYVMAGTPQWAARDPHAPYFATWIGEGSNSPPANMIDWEKYVWNIATRYKGRITHYQIWNEVQLREFWYPYTEVSDLGQMTKRAKSIINRIDPAAKIVAAPVLPRTSSGGMKRGAKYIATLHEHGWPVDIYSAHIYPEIKSGPTRWRNLAQSWKDVLIAQAAPHKPLWVTETNYALGGGPLKTKASIERDIRLTDEHARDLGIGSVCWYCWGEHSDPALLGIRFTDDSHGTTIINNYL